MLEAVAGAEKQLGSLAEAILALTREELCERLSDYMHDKLKVHAWKLLQKHKPLSRIKADKILDQLLDEIAHQIEEP